ncbi:hypothetical protein H6F42_19630 [Pseudanabaena sp. FACHB-1998]|uniref:hypothetical protein n=1 Tax=Pseudanabaena sp. FACHB-1998 TaxID=2692858 RepID=UPI0016804172|nr:hypothetical protein [Pseudanabaena sp. FACHB-1998]MBD2179139.1 hypothetical protein [Pseudanabaena sp. FACHB-1998]
MQAIRLPRYITATLFSILLFGFCFLIASLIDPNTFHKFFSAISLQAVENNQNIVDKAGYYYDVSAYANMAILDQCQAFYPMFSWIARFLFHPQTFEQAVIGLKIISCISFTISIPIYFNLLERISKSKAIAYLLTFIYTISPMAIFRVIGYTEGIFALLSLILLSIIISEKINKSIIYISAFLIVLVMSLTRPVSLQLIFSSCTTLIIIVFIEKAKSKLDWQELFENYKYKYRHLIILSLMIITATIIGYSIYGYLCFQSRGDFFAPFNDQKLWGKTLGFYPQIFLSLEYPLFEQISLYFPVIFLFGIIICLYSFINSSDMEVFIPQFPLFWGLISLYPSILIAIYIFVFLIKGRDKKSIITINLSNSHKTKKLFSSYTFWFCLSFVLSHIFINLFTVDKIYSLARFTFSLPFFFVFLGYILQNVKHQNIINILKLFVLIESIALIEQWVRYGRNLWLG